MEEGITIPFPFFVIGTADALVVTEADNTNCIISYATRELAELYIEQQGDPSLSVREIPDEAEAESLARQMVASGVHEMLWNTTRTPQTMRFVDLEQFIGE